MQDRSPDSSGQLGAADGEARREVLKTFGRYAAVAPAAMLLLEPHDGFADDDDDDDDDNGKGKGKDKNKDKDKGKGKGKGGYK